ncbi:hypothetical protein ALI144C_17040 [Actinosynnema sp. ALI-1.44]|uniref:hypothetical protein n=1 Tax=Actinosynnema sp. ALI-1.44 TaxID=1933779 RepID=UPI00097C633F|nr:hypothetical protein [Actinosynnema sp. ALI-1.44]ONI83201.1 hypothetical protein ALI144C_17040 [Actinosynnema sp. ALI-1.44]
MSVQLAFGITAEPEVRCWLPASGSKSMPRAASSRAGAHPPGAPVAVGPADAETDAVVAATDQLTLLVADGTEVAAGAGVDLGGGFASARLAGAYGDRRDAVLAALRVLGVDGAHRLGDRVGSLVALFGPSATKRVGAAANTAMAEQRWAALQLASAASEVLGPEQLERVLELRAPKGIDPFRRGAASTLSSQLSRVLADCPGPRRLALILSLWDTVCAYLVERQRQDRRAASQIHTDQIGLLHTRHRDHFDELVLRHLKSQTGDNSSLAKAARWRPPQWWTAHELSRLLDDAIAATALLRFARTMYDEGLEIAAEKHRNELVAADACMSNKQRTAARRRHDGDYSHPARPGCLVNDVLQPLRPGRTFTSKTEVRVKELVGIARNYGVVVLNAVSKLIETMDEPLHNCWDTCKPWQADHLRQWRAAAGFFRAPGSWDQPPLTDAHADGPKQTLAQRMATAEDLADVETPHDLLWFADLGDALAPFHGAESATVRHTETRPVLEYETPTPWEQGRPRADSIPLAAAGVAQLVAFGAMPPPRCGSWPELVDGVSAASAAVEASAAAFPIPSGISAVDKQTVPGTTLVVELGRDPRQLAAWSSYMGNCIGESWYADEARRGQCVLIALRDATDGRIAANLDIRQHTGGWRVHELRARFNDPVAPAVDKNVKRWVKGLPVPAPVVPEPLVPVPPVRSRGSARGAAAGRLPAALTGALGAAVAQELASATAVSARRTYAALARGLAADFEPDAAVIALKRLSPSRHVALLRAALDAGLGASGLWRATRVRPLTSAVRRLDPELCEYDRLDTLTGGSPLPRTLRALVRRPAIAPAYAMDVVARAVRAAMGELVGDEALARSVARGPAPELVCALAIAVTCAAATDDTIQVAAARKTSVPGFPASDLSDEDGPWQRALVAAAELGAPVELFWERIAEHGLLVPAAMVGRGGWAALWSRAHR